MNATRTGEAARPTKAVDDACRYCGSAALVEHRMPPGHPHYAELRCGDCDRQQRWLPTPAELRRPEPESRPEEILARFPRRGPNGEAEELRVALAEFKGRPFVSLRVWRRAFDGTWIPLKDKGLSVRLGEADGVVAALAEASARFDRPETTALAAVEGSGTLRVGDGQKVGGRQARHGSAPPWSTPAAQGQRDRLS